MQSIFLTFYTISSRTILLRNSIKVLKIARALNISRSYMGLNGPIEQFTLANADCKLVTSFMPTTINLESLKHRLVDVGHLVTPLYTIDPKCDFFLKTNIFETFFWCKFYEYKFQKIYSHNLVFGSWKVTDWNCNKTIVYCCNKFLFETFANKICIRKIDLLDKEMEKQTILLAI